MRDMSGIRGEIDPTRIIARRNRKDSVCAGDAMSRNPLMIQSLLA